LKVGPYTRTFFNVLNVFFKIRKHDFTFLSCCTPFLVHWSTPKERTHYKNTLSRKN